MSEKKRFIEVAVNEIGYRIGVSHHNCKIPDDIVNKIRDMHEEQLIGYRKLAKIFGLKRSYIQKICNYERRAQTPDRWKKVAEKSD